MERLEATGRLEATERLEAMGLILAPDAVGAVN